MEILFSNNDFIICIKPVGLDSEKEIPEQLKMLYPSEIYPVHRLDQNVSGIMIYARNKKYAAELSKAIQDGNMIKEYVALVHGSIHEEDTWEDYLFKDSHKNKVYVVKRIRKGVKKAKLSWQRIKTVDDCSLVHIRLYTGRSHQIRVQFSSRGYPLVGDHKYGSKSESKIPYLYSCKLTFPYHGEMLSFESYPIWAQ